MIAVQRENRELCYDELLALVSLAPGAILLADADGRFTYVNAAGCRLLGADEERIVGRTVATLVAEHEHPRLRALHSHALPGDEHVGEWTLRRLDGAYLAVVVHARLLRGGRWQVFVRESSTDKARTAGSDALRADSDLQAWRLETLLDTLPVAVLIFQAGGRLAFNRRASELLGTDLKPFGGGAEFASRIFGRDGKRVPPGELASERALSHGETVVAEEYVILRPDGERVLALGSAAPSLDERGRVTGAVAVFQVSARSTPPGRGGG